MSREQGLLRDITVIIHLPTDDPWLRYGASALNVWIVMRGKRMRRRLAATAAVTSAFVLFAAAPAFAEHVEPITEDGNPTCSELAPEGVTWTELKVEPVEDGTSSDGSLTVTIEVRDSADGPVFDWSSNIGLDAVFVKGGNVGGNLYQYDPPSEETADTGLHSPLNPSGKWAGLSHVSFCYDAGEETPTPTPTPTETPTESPTVQPTASESPAEVPTAVPAGADNGGGNGSAGLIGLVLAGGVAVAGAAAAVRRRTRHGA